MDNIVQFPEPEKDTPAQQAKELVDVIVAQIVCDLVNNGVILDPVVLKTMGTIVSELKTIAAHHYNLEEDSGNHH